MRIGWTKCLKLYMYGCNLMEYGNLYVHKHIRSKSSSMTVHFRTAFLKSLQWRRYLETTVYYHGTGRFHITLDSLGRTLPVAYYWVYFISLLWSPAGNELGNVQ